MSAPRFVIRKVLNRHTWRFAFQVHDTLYDEPVGQPYRKLRSAERRCDRCNAIHLIAVNKYEKAKDNG